MPDERPISSSESALKATYGNVGAKNFFACGGLSSVPEQFFLTIAPALGPLAGIPPGLSDFPPGTRDARIDTDGDHTASNACHQT